MRVPALLLAAVLFVACMPYAHAEEEQIFDDVRKIDWFYECVNYVYDRGIMDGTSRFYFDPSAACTRETVVTALYNLAGKPIFYGDTQLFVDVAPNDDCVDAIAWAVSEGIAYGYGDGNFGPYDTVTREQLACFMYRFAKYQGLRTNYSADFSRFKDVDQIGEYALDAFHWAVAVGIIVGTDEGTLIPLETSTRAQIASILMRYAEGYGF